MAPLYPEEVERIKDIQCANKFPEDTAVKELVVMGSQLQKQGICRKLQKSDSEFFKQVLRKG